MIPSPLDSYTTAAKWAFPSLLIAVLLYHFLGTYFSARVQQHWLDRLHGGNTPKGGPPRRSSPRGASRQVGVVSRWRRLVLTLW